MAIGIRGFAAIIAVAALMVIGVACGNGVEPTSLNEEAPTQAPPAVGGKTPTMPIVSHGGPVKDYASLVDNLRAAGATVDPAGTGSADYFAPQGQLLTVNGERVETFEFASAEAADAAAGGVSANGLSIVTTMADGTQGASMVDWFVPPHYYKAGRLIALYVGSGNDVIDALQDAMGAQFAGGESLPPTTPTTTLTPVQRLASRLSVMTLVVAFAEDGHGPWDNFLPCVRRGVINYYNTDGGRHATFSGCDLGDAIIVNGSGELKPVLLERSRETGKDRITISKIIWEGDLTAVIDGETEIQINEFALASVLMEISQGKGRELSRTDLDSMTVIFLGETMMVDDATLISQLFDTSAMDIDSIPNPSKSLSALTESDMKRLAYDQGLFLSSFILNESQRGNYTRDYPCGASSVIQNVEDQTTRIDNTWNGCDLASSGMFIDGTFSLEGNFDEELFSIAIEGTLAIGGGIPKVTIRRMEWALEGAKPLPAQVRIFGKIYGEVDERSFSFDLIVDD